MLNLSKLKILFISFIFVFTIISPSYTNSFKEVSACAGVVMADGALE